MTKILYFAWLREKLGAAEEDVELPKNLATVADLIAWQTTRCQKFAAAFGEKNQVRCAVDQDFASKTTPIAGAREIAFFPPVTGG